MVVETNLIKHFGVHHQEHKAHVQTFDLYPIYIVSSNSEHRLQITLSQFTTRPVLGGQVASNMEETLVGGPRHV